MCYIKGECYCYYLTSLFHLFISSFTDAPHASLFVIVYTYAYSTQSPSIALLSCLLRTRCLISCHSRTQPRCTIQLPYTDVPRYRPIGRGNDTVSLGMAHWVAPKPPVAKETMRVPSAAPQGTTLKSAVPPPNILTVKTPFIPDQWEKLLNAISPFNKFSDVPNSFRFGFDMGVHTPPQHTYTPPNHNSALSFPEHVLSHIHKELSLGRYSGPFSRSRLEFLIGPFRTSPLGTIPKHTIHQNAVLSKICPSPEMTPPIPQLMTRSISKTSDAIGEHLMIFVQSS